MVKNNPISEEGVFYFAFVCGKVISLPRLTFPSIFPPIQCLHFVFNYCIIKRELLCSFKHDQAVPSAIAVAAGIGKGHTVHELSQKVLSERGICHLLPASNLPQRTQGHTKFK